MSYIISQIGMLTAFPNMIVAVERLETQTLTFELFYLLYIVEEQVYCKT